MAARTMSGELTIARGWVHYEGSIDNSEAHSHAAFQLTIGLDGDLAIHDGVTWRRAQAFVVAPMVHHRFAAMRHVRIFYIEPHTATAAQWRARYGEGIADALELRTLRAADLLEADRERIIDERLQKVMALLSAPHHPGHLNALANSVGLSPQRLRTLAQRQLGMPLTRWRVWERLKRAVETLRTGVSLADAAQAGGFADQAHFTRDMKAMFGITPLTVQQLFRTKGGVDGNRT